MMPAMICMHKCINDHFTQNKNISIPRTMPDVGNFGRFDRIWFKSSCMDCESTFGFLLQGQLAELCPVFHKTDGIEHFTGFSFHLFDLFFPCWHNFTLYLSSLLLKILLQMGFFPRLCGDVINSDILACSSSVHKLTKTLHRWKWCKVEPEVMFWFVFLFCSFSFSVSACFRLFRFLLRISLWSSD